MRKICSVLFVMVWAANLSAQIPYTAANIQKTATGRYEPPAKLEERPASQVFNQEEYKGDKAMLDGYGKKTVAELGLAGKEVWNEYPGKGIYGRAVKVVLSANAVVFYDTASMEPLYLDGCLRNDKPWINRVKLVEPLPPPPPPESVMQPPVVRLPPALDVCPNIEGAQTRVPEGLVQDAAGNCIAPPPPQITQAQQCPTCPPPPPVTAKALLCPASVEIKAVASKLSRSPLAIARVSNFFEVVGSMVGGAAGGSFLSSNSKIKSATYRSTGASAALWFAANFMNPDKDGVRVSIGGRPVSAKPFARGGGKWDGTDKFSAGYVRWYGRTASVFVQVEGINLYCGSLMLPSNINFTPLPLPKR